MKKSRTKTGVTTRSSSKSSKTLLKALQTTDSSLAILLDAVHDSLLLLDLEGRVISCNATAASRLGFSTKDLVGHSIYEILPAELADARRQQISQIIQTGQEIFFEDVREGRFYKHYLSPLMDSEGRVIRVAIYAQDVSSYRETEDHLKRQKDLLASIRQAQALFISGHDPGRIFQDLLHILIQATDSEYGFLDEVLRDPDGTPYKLNLAMSDLSWDEDSKRLYALLVGRKLEFRNLNNLAGVPVIEGRTIISNAPSNHPRSKGIPAGHPAIHTYMGVPLFFEDEVIGVAGVANRPGGYTEDIADFIQPLTQACAAIIWAQRMIRHREDALESLRRREEKYRQLFSEMRYGSALHDIILDEAGIPMDYVTLDINASFEQILGVRKEDLIGRKASDFLSPVELARWLEVFGPVALGGESRPYEIYSPSQDKYFEGTVYSPDRGKFAVAFSDVTERKKTEARLDSSRAELRAIHDHAPVMICVVDEERRVLYANRALSDFLGIPAQDLSTDKVGEVLGCLRAQENSGGCGLGIGCETCELRLAVEDTLRTGAGHQNIERRMTLCRGTLRRRVDFLGATACISTHEKKNVLLCLHDITDRKEAEDALRQANTKFSAIFSAIPDLFFHIRLDGTILDFKAGRSSDLYAPPEVFLGNKIQSVLPPSVSSNIWQAIQRLPAETDVTVEYELPLSSGTQSFEARLFAHGQEEAFGVVRNVTIQKKAEADRLRSQHLESLGLLAGGIAHDFNNLLTGILGNIEMARACSKQDSGSLGFLDKAMGVTERAKALADQLLTFSKGGTPVRKPGNLGETVSKNVPFALSGSNVSPLFKIDPMLWVCDFDESQIGQALDNLIINAQQAMPTGGNIEIEACNISLEDPVRQKSGRFVMISIQDHGIGIPENLLPRIFDPFFTTKQKGQGLGLATTHSIVEKHAGFMDVESTPGVGSTFRLYFPASDKDRRDLNADTPACHCGTGRLLIMDDEEFIRDLVSDMLVSMGYSVVALKDGREVLAEYARGFERGNPYKAVLLDLTVPGGQGGREIVRDLQRLDPQAIVIAASGYSADPVMSNPHEHGFSGSIRKPFSLVDLGRLLTDLLSKG